MNIREARRIVVAIILLGLTMIISYDSAAGFRWSWILFGFGLLIMLISFGSNDKGLVLPVSVLMVNSIALIARDFGWFAFPIWRIWAIFFGSLGSGLLAAWAFKGVKFWVLVPGGLLLIVCGAGLAIDSWWDYQRWLRKMVDHWYIFLLIFLLSIVISHRYRKTRTLVDEDI